MLNSLQSLFQTRHKELLTSEEQLQDVPCGRYHDKYLAEADALLEQQTEFYNEWQEQDSPDIYMAFRAEWSPLAKTPSCKVR
jgi:hypothetical protein